MSGDGGTRACGIFARDVHKRFGNVVALTGVDVAVEPGEIVALMGENGSGKSTLLRILATTVTADAGQLTVAGHDVGSEPHAVRGRIGCILGDDRSWYWRLTGRQNLEFFGSMHGLAPSQRDARIDRLLEQQGVASAADRPVSDYSTGMRLRLALARALLHEPAVVLLDEPSRSLDPDATVALRDELVALAREGRVAVLLATHDLQDAKSIANRTVILRGGRAIVAEAAHDRGELVGTRAEA